MRGAVHIYALCDPSTEEVRYVGQTRQAPAARADQHATLFEWTELKGPWIAELQARGVKPLVRVLEVIDDTAAVEREKHHISLHLAQGANLLNVQHVPGRRSNPRPNRGLHNKMTVRFPDGDAETLRRMAEDRGVEPAVLVRMWAMEHIRDEQRREFAGAGQRKRED